jgi:hypothetical protein
MASTSSSQIRLEFVFRTCQFDRIILIPYREIIYRNLTAGGVLNLETYLIWNLYPFDFRFPNLISRSQ